MTGSLCPLLAKSGHLLNASPTPCIAAITQEADNDRRQVHYDSNNAGRVPYPMTLLEHYKGHPFSYFFVSMLALILLSPLVGEDRIGDWIYRTLFTAMIVFAVNAASDRLLHKIVAISLALPWLLLSWLSGLVSWHVPLGLTGIILVALNFFVGSIILYKVSTAPKVDLDTLSGALGLYLLIAITWAVSFAVIEYLVPGSFAAEETPIPWSRYLYFSLTTMTTLGYGDILPTGSFARVWATMEAVTGTLYIAVLVARLVSLYKYKL
ncbi:MAG: potassium channel family protein [Alphaproteobacteria bacterium]|nr:potassium channel family protein [Alphaproteobacteria bacterium]